MSLSQPKSWFAFLIAAGVGFLVFLPMAIVGVGYQRIPLFLSGLTGAGIVWLLAAAAGIFLAQGILKGRYRDLHPASWREQVW